jgi:superfamily I DNA/RNA helicase
MQVEEKNHSMEKDIVKGLVTEIVEEPISDPRFAKKEVTEKPIDVDDDSMDDDQLDLIEKTLDESMIVAGCAGSGKSVIAMHKAQQILDSGGDVIMIALTKSLCLFMNQGNKGRYLGSHFYYHWRWKHIGMPSADYIIVDEIQDFSCEEIQEFINSAKKCFFFFGDTAQSIYKFTEKQTLSIEQIAKMTGLEPLQLYNNYRLPRAVAQITQRYVGVDVNPYSEKIYQSKEKALPHIVPFANIKEQADAIIKIAEKSNSPSIGILIHSNEQVIQLMQLLNERNFVCEVKYGNGFNDENKNTLNFQTKRPKLMTYHSAKGLQFETVILPLYEGAIDLESRKALYVAMTRTYRNLYIMYNGVLSSPLKEVDSKYYLKTL